MFSTVKPLKKESPEVLFRAWKVFQLIQHVTKKEII